MTLYVMLPVALESGIARIFGQGQGTSEASALRPPQAIFFGFLPCVKPLDAIWQ